MWRFGKLTHPGPRSSLAALSFQFAVRSVPFRRLLLEKQGKVIDNEYALKLKELDIQAKVAVAEIENEGPEPQRTARIR